MTELENLKNLENLENINNSNPKKNYHAPELQQFHLHLYTQGGDANLQEADDGGGLVQPS